MLIYPVDDDEKFGYPAQWYELESWTLASFACVAGTVGCIGSACGVFLATEEYLNAPTLDWLLPMSLLLSTVLIFLLCTMLNRYEIPALVLLLWLSAITGMMFFYLTLWVYTVSLRSRVVLAWVSIFLLIVPCCTMAFYWGELYRAYDAWIGQCVECECAACGGGILDVLYVIFWSVFYMVFAFGFGIYDCTIRWWLDGADDYEETEAGLYGVRDRKEKRLHWMKIPAKLVVEEFFDSCLQNGKLAIKEGLLEQKYIDVSEPYLQTGIPGLAILEGLLKSLEQQVQGILVADRIELVERNRPVGPVGDAFFDTLVGLKQDVFNTNLSDVELLFFRGYIASCNRYNPEGVTISEERKAVITGLATRIHALAGLLMKVPTFKLRVSRIVENLGSDPRVAYAEAAREAEMNMSHTEALLYHGGIMNI